MKYIFIFALAFLPLCAHNQVQEQSSTDLMYAIPINVEELTIEQRITLVLEDAGLDSMTVKLMVAQSKHESGDYKNSLTRKHNNVFARHWDKRDTLSLGSGGKAEGHSRFARYESVEKATLSQLAYFKRKGYSMKWASAEEFAKELKSKHYYEDSTRNYVNALRRHLTKSGQLGIRNQWFQKIQTEQHQSSASDLQDSHSYHYSEDVQQQQYY